MEGRCAAETWAEFGRSETARTPKIAFASGTEVLLCPGSDEIYVFNTRDRKLQAVLQFPGPVGDLVLSPDQQLIYVASEGGVYCVSLTSLLSGLHSSPADVPALPFELKVSSDFLAVTEEAVVSLLLVGSVLVTLSHGETLWRWTLHKTPAEQPSSDGYETLGTFSLPVVSDAVCDGNEGKKKRGQRRRPVLICAHYGDKAPFCSSSSSETTVADSHCHLESVLFKLLFGVDVSLVKSPVILCGLPDGRLCSLPLRPLGSRLSILHSLEQPVIFVGASAAMETDPGAQCLVAVGELGKVVLIRTSDRGSDGGGKQIGFTERCVPGPVVCVSVDKHRLYYSSGSDLLVLDLSGGSAQTGQSRDESEVHDGETPRKGLTAVLQSPISLNVCRITAMTRPTQTSAGEVHLLVLSARGQLQRITLPPRREGAGLPRIPPAPGKNIKDLLSAIGDVCERASALKNSIKSRNQTLRHLNQVLNISFLLLAGTSHEEQTPMLEKPIRCRAMTGWSRLLGKDSLNLTCVLDNRSPYVLERGWTLSVTVFPLCGSHSAGGESSCRNFSFPVLNINPGEKFEVSLPLVDVGDSCFPMTVSCSLIFALQSLVGEEEAASFLDLQSSHVCLSLTTLTVDWLDALLVNRTAVTHKNATSQFQDIDTVQAFLRSRQTGRGKREAEQEQYSATIRMSSELLRTTLAPKTPQFDPEEPNLAHSGLCVSVLDWLLSDRPGGGMIEPQRDKTAISSSVVHARGPNGHAVTLTVKEVDAKEGSLAAVEVQVQSSSLPAVCGVHHAVLRRVQMMLQRAPEKAASTVKVQDLGLRQALQRTEVLLQQIQQIHITEAFGVGSSRGQMNRSLLSAYRELRENPLLII